MTTGERIRERRKELGITADSLADSIGVSRSTMFRYENGYIEKMPINNLVPIANALCTTVSYLMGWVDEKTPTPSSEGGLDGIDLQIADIILRLSPEKKREAFRYLQYLESREDM